MIEPLFSERNLIFALFLALEISLEVYDFWTLDSDSATEYTKECNFLIH